MVYLYKKTIGGKNYYYLRVSERKGDRVLSKDVAYLGSSPEEVKKALTNVQQRDVRAAYKSIKRFLESNVYEKEVEKEKMPHSPYISAELLKKVEACKIHWQQTFLKKENKTREDYLATFAVEFSFNTTAIEGNTITLKQATQLLQENITPSHKTLREIHDVQNTQRSFLALFKNSISITNDSIIAIHKELMQNIDQRTGYRTDDVRVFRARFDATPAQYVTTDMNILFELHKKTVHFHPLARAAIFHHKFEKIHPFFDGNGRTGRMLMNAILIGAGYPPLIVRNRKRKAYLDALAKADAIALTDTLPAGYAPLVEFLAKELVGTYWNSFL